MSEHEAVERLADALNAYLETSPVYPDAFMEVDENHDELWVHELNTKSAGETLSMFVEEFVGEATDESGSVMRCDITLTEYHESSNHDGYVLYVSHIRFGGDN